MNPEISRYFGRWMVYIRLLDDAPTEKEIAKEVEGLTTVASIPDKLKDLVRRAQIRSGYNGR